VKTPTEEQQHIQFNAFTDNLAIFLTQITVVSTQLSVSLSCRRVAPPRVEPIAATTQRDTPQRQHKTYNNTREKARRTGRSGITTEGKGKAKLSRERDSVWCVLGLWLELGAQASGECCRINENSKTNREGELLSSLKVRRDTHLP
jgi:hypothetical protein